MSITEKQAQREALAMSYDPFAGDYGGAGSGDRTLSDKIVTARKGGECHHCTQDVVPGTRIRSRAEVYDGGLMSFRWCAVCTAIMGFKDSYLGEKALERRLRLRGDQS